MGHCVLIFTFVLFNHCWKTYSQENNGASSQDFHQNQEARSLETDSFNKTVFVIPITGILLVFAMVLLYIFYTWQLTREENETEQKHRRGQSNESQIGHDDFQSQSGDVDAPPSYLEATISKETGSNPPTYGFSTGNKMMETRSD